MVVLVVGATLGSTTSSAASLSYSTSRSSSALGESSCVVLRRFVWQYWKIILSFTQYTQSVPLGKCSTIVSNMFNRLSFNIVRCSNSRPPSALGPTDVYSYVVCLAYVVHLLSLFKSVLPKVVNSCIPTIYSHNEMLYEIEESNHPNWLNKVPWYNTSICSKFHGKLFEHFIRHARADRYNLMCSTIEHD